MLLYLADEVDELAQVLQIAINDVKATVGTGESRSRGLQYAAGQRQGGGILADLMAQGRPQKINPDKNPRNRRQISRALNRSPTCTP